MDSLLHCLPQVSLLGVGRPWGGPYTKVQLYLEHMEAFVRRLDATERERQREREYRSGQRQQEVEAAGDGDGSGALGGEDEEPLVRHAW